jgi:hypothetical protein
MSSTIATRSSRVRLEPALAVALMEPLVDIHWQEIQSALEGALDRSARLRDVMRGCILHVPDAVEQSLLNHAHA